MVYNGRVRFYGAGERMKAATAVRDTIIGAAARLRLGRRAPADRRRVPDGAGVMPLAAAIAAALLAFAPAPAEAQSAQRVLSVSIQPNPGADGFYTDGETITVRVRFSGPGRPRLFGGQSASIDIDIGGVTQKATISGERHQTEWDLTYRVRQGDRDLDGISIPANGLSGQFSCGTGCTPNMAHSAVSTTQNVLATPSAPSDFRAKGGAGQATLTWDRDTGAHSSRAYEYRQDGGSWTSAGGANASGLTVTLAAGTYRFELRAQNRSGAGAATNAVSVTVSAATDGGPSGPSGPGGTVSAVVDPTSLTVVEGRSRTYQVRLSAEPAADVTVAIASSAAAVVTAAPAELTFTASDWSTPQTVTVTAAQDDDTDDGAATLSHTLSGSGVEPTGPPLRVTVTDDDAAGVDVPDALTFGEKEVAAQSYTVGAAVNVTLPAATGGTPPLSYRLTPDLPEGLSFNAATRVLSGTPAEAAEQAEYTLTVTDAQDYRVELRFSITVEAADAPAAGEEAGPAQVRSTALANVLAAFGGSVAADAVEVVGDRFTAVGPRLQLPEGATDADAMLAGTAFAAPAPGGFALWGRGALSGFSTATEDGTVLSGYLGADWRGQPDILVGGAVAYSTAGDVTYRGAAGAAAGSKGKATVTTVVALPYAHWSPSRGLGVWALAGLGGGAAAVTPAGSRAAIETGVFLTLGAAGVRYDVIGWPGGSAAVKVDGLLASLSAAQQTGLAAANATPGRLRLLFEGRTRWEFLEQSWLQPVVEVGGRFDGAIGAEFGGGVSYRHTGIGLGADVRGRYVLAERQEWGASAALSYTLGESGWSFALNLATAPEEHTGSPAYALAIHGSLRM